MGYYVDKELYHHGIKGQRWGIRRFQSYDGTRIGKGSESATSPVAKKGLTDEQKRALKIGAGIVAGCLVAYGGYKLATYPEARKAVNNVLSRNKSKRLADLDNVGSGGFDDGIGAISKVRDIVKVDGNYLKMSDSEKSAIVKGINSENGVHNCQACTAAFDVFRKTGYVFKIRGDVDTTSFQDDDFMNKLYKGFTGFKTAMPADSFTEFSSSLENAYKGTDACGRLTLKGVKGGTHAVSFYMQNGKMRVVESQTKRDLSAEEFGKHFNSSFDWNLIKYARTDNLDFQDGALEYLGRMSQRIR